MWFFPALISALTDAVDKTLAKRWTQQYSDAVVAIVPTGMVCVLLLPILFVADIYIAGVAFWVIVFLRATLDGVARLLLIQVFRSADLSLTFPLLSLTPVFLVGVEYIVTRELPSRVGFIGILCIVLGAILLQTFGNKTYTWKSIRNHHTFQNALVMIGIAFVYSITSLLHRLGIAQSNVFTYVAISQTAIFLVLLAIAGPGVWRSQKTGASALQPKKVFRDFLPMAVLIALGIVTQMFAQSITLASYVIATKRSSIVFSALFSALVFKEKIARRLPVIVFMFVGIVLLAFQ